MKVGIYIGDENPRSGGGYTFVGAVLKALGARAAEHDIVVLHRGDERIGADNGHRAIRVGLPPHRSIARRAMDRLGIHRNGAPVVPELDRLGLDFIWFLTPSTMSTHLPYAITVWDIAHRVSPSFPELRNRPWGWADRDDHYWNWLPRASYVITGGNDAAADISRVYGVHPTRIRVLPLVAPDLPANDDAAPLPSGSFLLYPAQFWPHKNHVGLLHALKTLRERHGMDMRLVFTGGDKGNLSHVRSVVSSLGLTSSVDFEGFVTPERLATLYRHASAMVFPSFLGPDNLPPLEALHAGCPVIAADVPGVREQLGDAAVLIDPANSDAIADAICRVLQDQQLRDDLTERGRARAARWTAADYASAMFRVMDEFEKERRTWSDHADYVQT